MLKSYAMVATEREANGEAVEDDEDDAPVMPVKSKGKKKGDDGADNEDDGEQDAAEDKAAAEERRKKIEGYLHSGDLKHPQEVADGVCGTRADCEVGTISASWVIIHESRPLRYKQKACAMVRTHVKLIVEEDYRLPLLIAFCHLAIYVQHLFKYVFEAHY
eukprot:s1675_g7.t1